jgi:hypothetical protein
LLVVGECDQHSILSASDRSEIHNGRNAARDISAARRRRAELDRLLCQVRASRGRFELDARHYHVHLPLCI